MQRKRFMDDYGVLERLIFNQRSPADAEALASTLGMVHLYRASGVHLLAFFSFLKFFVEWVSKRLGLGAERSQFCSLVVSGFAIFWIWHLQDFRVTFLRPILTFLFRAFFQARGAKAKIFIPLGLTFISESLWSSETSWSEGALHYYLSVAGGLVGYHLSGERTSWQKHLFLATGSWLPMAVIDLIRHHQISYLTPFYSLVSLPIISIFLYPLTLMDLLIHHQISGLTIFLWNKFVQFLFLVPDLGPTFFAVDGFALGWGLIFAGGLSLNWAALKKRPDYSAGIVLGLIIFRVGSGLVPKPNWVVQLDVGQGDSSIIRDRSGRTEMIDVGSLKTYGEKDWLAKLSEHEVLNVDGVLLSHLDEDHVGALKELLFLVRVTCIQTHTELWASEKGQRLSQWLEREHPEVKRSGSACVLLPEVAWFKSTKSSGNELMAGIFYAGSEHEAYLAEGDADEEQELQYENYFKAEIATHPFRIWKISHHGSRFSSNFNFLRDLNPQAFLISVGKHNPYHHPNPQTLLRLSLLGGKVYRTDVDGDVSFSFKE